MAKTITTTESDNDSIELTKNTKGYGWTVKCYGTNTTEMLGRIELLEKSLKEKYGVTNE
jgi:hypothetical protein